MKLIVAVDEKWGIGKNGDLLLSIPDDMRFFRETTRRAVLVMGYNTLMSFPGGRPLPGRMNIVLNDTEGVRADGTVICGSIEQLFGFLRDMNSDDVFVIGGGSVYRQLLPYCDTAYITKMRFCGDADTFIPDLDGLSEWSVISESEIKEHEGIKYSFIEYRNSAPLSVGFSGVNSDMPSYFVKRAEIGFTYPDITSGEYHDELNSLIKAYFRPLYGGVSCAEVAECINSSMSAEAFLKEKGCIASAEDFERLYEKYAPDNKGGHTVRVTKERAAEFIESDLNADKLAELFS